MKALMSIAATAISIMALSGRAEEKIMKLEAQAEVDSSQSTLTIGPAKHGNSYVPVKIEKVKWDRSNVFHSSTDISSNSVNDKTHIKIVFDGMKVERDYNLNVKILASDSIANGVKSLIVRIEDFSGKFVEEFEIK